MSGTMPIWRYAIVRRIHRTRKTNTRINKPRVAAADRALLHSLRCQQPIKSNVRVVSPLSFLLREAAEKYYTVPLNSKPDNHWSSTHRPQAAHAPDCFALGEGNGQGQRGAGRTKAAAAATATATPRGGNQPTTAPCLHVRPGLPRRDGSPHGLTEPGVCTPT